MHLALGSTWSAIARQLLIEGVMLSLAATVLAVPLASWFAQGLGVMLWTAPWPMGLRLTPDATVLGAMLVGGLLCGAIVSLPSVAFWRARPARIGGSSSARTVTGGINWAGRTLIAGQLALTLTLMFSSGLFMQHLARLRTIDPGYRGEVRVLLINHGREPYTVQAGDRIAQLIIARYETVEWEEGEVGESQRGTGGFGSSGR